MGALERKVTLVLRAMMELLVLLVLRVKKENKVRLGKREKEVLLAWMGALEKREKEVKKESVEKMVKME
jgi:predicted component of type VI protein secretion system